MDSFASTKTDEPYKAEYGDLIITNPINSDSIGQAADSENICQQDTGMQSTIHVLNCMCILKSIRIDLILLNMNLYGWALLSYDLFVLAFWYVRLHVLMLTLANCNPMCWSMWCAPGGNVQPSCTHISQDTSQASVREASSIAHYSDVRLNSHLLLQYVKVAK